MLNHIEWGPYHNQTARAPPATTTSDCGSKAHPAGPVTARTRTLLGGPWGSNWRLHMACMAICMERQLTPIKTVFNTPATKYSHNFPPMYSRKTGLRTQQNRPASFILPISVWWVPIPWRATITRPVHNKALGVAKTVINAKSAFSVSISIEPPAEGLLGALERACTSAGPHSSARHFK